MKLGMHSLLRTVALLLLTTAVYGSQHYSVASCNASLPKYHINETGYQIPNGTVDQNGRLTQVVLDIVGYTYDTCLEVCGSGVDRTDFIPVIQQLTLWFLPYLTLLAQVPFMTEHDLWGDVEVVVYTLGSPMLAIYSLFLSLFNWKWIKHKCRRDLQQYETDEDMVKILPDILGRLQSYPITVPNTALLAAALALPENKEWWTTLQQHLEDRERKLDASGTAQLSLAAVVYIFAVSEAFAEIGDSRTAHGLAIGSLFLWLIPLVWGWFAISTQFGRKDRTNRLFGNQNVDLYSGYQTDANGITSLKKVVDKEARLIFRIHDPPGQVVRDPQSLSGDEQRMGPFYNFARANTWSHFCQKIVDAYIAIQQNRNHEQLVGIEEEVIDKEGRIQAVLGTDVEQNRGPHNSKSTAMEAAETILGKNWDRFVSRKRGVEHTGYLSRSRRAFLCAFVLQGLTGWAAVMIAFQTPTVGLGCRSFTFMMYCLLSFSSCLCLLLASYLSDCRSSGNNWFLNHVEKFFRKIGKLAALLNATIIILGCFLQFTGVFNNCYCDSDKISRGSAAFLVFLSPSDKADLAGISWGIGFAMALAPCLVAIFFIEISRRDIQKQ